MEQIQLILELTVYKRYQSIVVASLQQTVLLLVLLQLQVMLLLLLLLMVVIQVGTYRVFLQQLRCGASAQGSHVATRTGAIRGVVLEMKR